MIRSRWRQVGANLTPFTPGAGLTESASTRPQVRQGRRRRVTHRVPRGLGSVPGPEGGPPRRRPGRHTNLWCTGGVARPRLAALRVGVGPSRCLGARRAAPGRERAVARDDGSSRRWGTPSKSCSRGCWRVGRGSGRAPEQASAPRLTSSLTPPPRASWTVPGPPGACGGGPAARHGHAVPRGPSEPAGGQVEPPGRHPVHGPAVGRPALVHDQGAGCEVDGLAVAVAQVHRLVGGAEAGNAASGGAAR